MDNKCQYIGGYVSVTGQLVENIVAGKIAVDVRRRDDFLTNLALHDKTYGENLGSFRGQLL